MSKQQQQSNTRQDSKNMPDQKNMPDHAAPSSSMAAGPWTAGGRGSDDRQTNHAGARASPRVRAQQERRPW